ncbi:MAG: GumC family protein [Dysgonomonas sp.]
MQKKISKENDWSNEDQLTITDVIFEYVRYWKWFVISIALFLLIGIIIIATSKLEYKQSLSILLNEGENKSSGTADFNLEALGLMQTTNNIDNEIAILTSPDLIGQVVDSLGLNVSYYKRNKLRDIEIYDKSPFSVNVLTSDGSVNKKISLKFHISKTNSKYLLNGTLRSVEGDNIEIKEEISGMPALINLPDSAGVLSIKLTDEKIKESEKYYILINTRTTTVNALVSKLLINSTTKYSSVLNISLETENVNKGAVILKELVKQYNELNNRVNNQVAYKTSLFINDRLKEISRELGDAEEDVVDYKQKNKITDLSSEAKLFVEQSGDNEHRLIELETQINILSLIENFINNPVNKYALIPNLEITDPALSKIIIEYNDKLLRNDLLMKNTGEDNPSRKKILAEVDNTKMAISTSLKNTKQAYILTKQDIEKQIRVTQSRIQSVPQQERGLLEKVRQQQIKESLFLFLMQKREETNISIASSAEKARVITSPRETLDAVSPKSKIILLAVFILGIALPIILIYLIKLFKTKVSNRVELEQLSNVDIVGEICKNSSKDDTNIVVLNNSNGAIVEMFRSLRNNLNFIFKHEYNKAILVTSTMPGEGKTFISINLAFSYIMAGKSVLLIGADIRIPKLKVYLDLDGKLGLTDYLIDSDSDWKKYINTVTEKEYNLDVIISGTIPPNPNELLMSPKLKTLLSEAKKNYDIVILDTAPVGSVSDTYMVSEFVDISLYVVRENVTPKNAIAFINLQEEENKLNNLYIVFNGSSLDGNYKYGYGRTYGYKN